MLKAAPMAALIATLATGWAAAQTDGTIGQQPLPDFSLQVDELLNQEILIEELNAGTIQSIPLTPGASTRPRAAPIVRVERAPGAVLRGLDKVSGEVRDMELASGESAELGRLTVELGECRYPTENPSGDASVYLTVRADGLDRPAFEGWMIASSPALSALDHPRYDVWVIRCSST